MRSTVLKVFGISPAPGVPGATTPGAARRAPVADPTGWRSACPPPRAGPIQQSPASRGKEFPADPPPCRFLSRSPIASCPVQGLCLSEAPGGPTYASCTMQSRLLLLGAPGGLGDVASRRVRLLLRQVLRGRPGGDQQRLEVRLLHSGATDSGNWALRLRCRCPRCFVMWGKALAPPGLHSETLGVRTKVSDA